jgi:hypothetical protein
MWMPDHGVVKHFGQDGKLALSGVSDLSFSRLDCAKCVGPSLAVRLGLCN